MPSATDIRNRSYALLIREGATSVSIAESPGRILEKGVSDAVLLESLRKAHAAGLRSLILVSETQFAPQLKSLRAHAEPEALARIGLIVFSEQPDLFLQQHSTTPELINCVSEQQFQQSGESILLRATHQLFRREDRESRKIGQKTLERLNQIFITLSAERNPQRLLATILAEAIELTEAETGVLHVVDEVDGEYVLKMQISSSGKDEMLLQHVNEKAAEDSFVGWVVLTGNLLNLNSKGTPPRLKPLHYKVPTFEQEAPFKSILVVPLKNSRNEIVGVLQLRDKKSDPVHPNTEMPDAFGSFDHEDESLITSFATQAAICLENLELYADLRGVFDGFVRAAITAIESRDPSTGGHSERVAKMTVALAQATNDMDKGVYRSVRFKPEEIRELNYAALLHDFGKIGVREEVLVKAKKLYPFQLDAIRERIQLWKSALYLDRQQKLLSKSMPDTKVEGEYQRALAALDAYWELILKANEPSVLPQESMTQLEHILHEKFSLPDGYEIPLLLEEEYHALSIPRGSLTNVERLEVESHVRHTYQFLKMIPWSRGFKNLPEIAFAHHEKLDGSGYPRGLTSHEIPLQSKIMTIADIYDALTAADRWYKDAVPAERALDILKIEVKDGKLDPVLVEIFLDAKIYELVSPRQNKKIG